MKKPQITKKIVTTEKHQVIIVRQSTPRLCERCGQSLGQTETNQIEKSRSPLNEDSQIGKRLLKQ